MKVVIELIGYESRESLLATSNYLRELAESSLPVSAEAKIYNPYDEATANVETDLDKLADEVVEATKVKDEEKPKTVSEMAESERAKTRAKRAAKPAPVEEPAKVEEPAPVEKPAKPETDTASYTIDDCKSWAMKALNAKKRPIVQEAFESVGASSFPTLKEEMFNDFVAYISSRL